MPFPAEAHFAAKPLLAITWTLQHMTRMLPSDTHLADTLQKYLANILEDPSETRYRQIRIGSPKFGQLWSSPVRGLLLAIGFSEVGAYAEIGCPDEPLDRQRIQEVALLTYFVKRWQGNDREQPQQPLGASDGYGRAGFGRAGTIE